MSVDARMAYYGSKTYRARGPAHGLLLKTIPGSDPPGAAYIVSAQATAAGITVSVGAVEDSSAGAAAYAFLGTGDGHAQAERSDWFPQRFILDNKSSELGYWHLSGDLSVDPTTNTVTIEYALRSPDGTEQTGRWLDDGDSAHIGSGDVGLVNQGVWSIDNRYDNLSITIND